MAGALYVPRLRFENVWVEQCRATKAITRRFGAKTEAIAPGTGLHGDVVSPMTW